jgi:hypothetical protein
MMNDGIYQSAFNAAPDSELLVAPNPEFTILAVNDSLLRTSYRKRDELVGKGILEAFPVDPADPQDTGEHALHESLSRVITTRKPDDMPLQRYPIAVPMEDGSQRYEERFWSATNTPIFDENGRLVCISHRTIDVTEQKRASDAASFLAARERFQLGIEDRIRPLTDPDEVTAAACKHLGRQLDAGRVLYVWTGERPGECIGSGVQSSSRQTRRYNRAVVDSFHHCRNLNRSAGSSLESWRCIDCPCYA